MKTSRSGINTSRKAIAFLALMIGAGMLAVLPNHSIIPDAFGITSTFVQSRTCSATGSSSYTCAYTSGVTSGNSLFVMVASGATVSSVTDSQGTDTKYTSGTDGSSDSVSVYGRIATSTGANTVTVTLSGSASASVFIFEFSGDSAQGINFNVGSGTSTTTACGGGQIPTNGSAIISVVSAVTDPLSSYAATGSFTALSLATYGGAEYLASAGLHDVSLNTDEGRATITASTVQWESACIYIPPTRAANGFTVSNLHTIAGPGVEPVSTESPAGNKEFWADGLWWLFYSNSSAGLFWRTSEKGVSTWSASTTASSTAYAGDNWALWNNATTVCYVGADQTSNFVYRCGSLSSGGSITWRAAQATAGGTAGQAATDNNPTVTVDSSHNLWVDFRSKDAHNFFNILVWKGASLGSSWAQNLDINMSADGTGTDHSAQIWTYGGADTTDIGIYAGTYAGGTTNDVLFDYNSGTGVWGPGGCTAPCTVSSGAGGQISFLHMEPHRGGITVVGTSVYAGSACVSGATDLCFWRHNFGNTTTMSGASLQDFPRSASQLTNTPDYLKDTQASIATDGSGDFYLIDANSWEQSTTTQVYLLKSTNSGTTWGTASVLAQNENGIWGAPTLANAKTTNGTGFIVVWTASLASAVISNAAAAYQIRVAWVPLAPATVTDSLTCSLAQFGATSMTVSLTVSSGSVVPNTAGCSKAGTVTSLTVNPSATITATMPTISAGVGYWVSGKANTTTTTAPSSGSGTWSFTAYQLSTTTGVIDANAQTDFDTGMTWTQTCTQAGATGSCSISSTAATSDSKFLKVDYKSILTFPGAPSGAPAGTRWESTGTLAFNITTAAQTETVQSWKQDAVATSYATSGTSGSAPSAPTLTYTQFGATVHYTETTSPVTVYPDVSTTCSAPSTISNGAKTWTTAVKCTNAASGAFEPVYYLLSGVFRQSAYNSCTNVAVATGCTVTLTTAPKLNSIVVVGWVAIMPDCRAFCNMMTSNPFSVASTGTFVSMFDENDGFAPPHYAPTGPDSHLEWMGGDIGYISVTSSGIANAMHSPGITITLHNVGAPPNINMVIFAYEVNSTVGLVSATPYYAISAWNSGGSANYLVTNTPNVNTTGSPNYAFTSPMQLPPASEIGQPSATNSTAWVGISMWDTSGTVTGNSSFYQQGNGATFIGQNFTNTTPVSSGVRQNDFEADVSDSGSGNEIGIGFGFFVNPHVSPASPPTGGGCIGLGCATITSSSTGTSSSVASSVSATPSINQQQSPSGSTIPPSLTQAILENAPTLAGLGVLIIIVIIAAATARQGLKNKGSKWRQPRVSD